MFWESCLNTPTKKKLMNESKIFMISKVNYHGMYMVFLVFNSNLNSFFMKNHRADDLLLGLTVSILLDTEISVKRRSFK